MSLWPKASLISEIGACARFAKVAHVCRDTWVVTFFSKPANWLNIPDKHFVY